MPTTTAHPAAALFRGLAEPSRLMILQVLGDAEHTVTEICDATGLGQSNVSNHLACLLGCRLVAREQRGRFAHYRLADERISALLELGGDIGRGASSDDCCPVCGSEPW